MPCYSNVKIGFKLLKYMRALSIDLGTVRTGFAISDCTGFLASPLCVVKEADVMKLLLKVMELIEKYKITDVAIGLPKNMDGSEGESAIRARKFKSKLQQMVDICISFVDERWSTKSAQYYLNIGTTKAKKKKNIVDEVAATVILQQYLDTKRTCK